MLMEHNLYHRKNLMAGQENFTYMSNEPKIIHTTAQTQHFVDRSEPLVEVTYDKAPTVIRHDEKSVFETHTAPT